MPNRYPYSELEVFVAGYERGRAFLAERRTDGVSDPEQLAREEVASRRLSLYNLTRKGLLMAGLEARFEPRSLFEAGVRRGLAEEPPPPAYERGASGLSSTSSAC